MLVSTHMFVCVCEREKKRDIWTSMIKLNKSMSDNAVTIELNTPILLYCYEGYQDSIYLQNSGVQLYYLLS